MTLRRLRLAMAAAVAAMLSVLAAAAQQFSLPSPASSQPGTPVVVFAAASLKTALDRIAGQWTSNTGRRVTFSYASSGALAKQIESGAPADLYASANIEWVDYLAGKGLVDATSRDTLLSNRLVLIAPRNSNVSITITHGFPLAELLGDGRLAMGTPGTVPAGTYAKASLVSLGVWDPVKNRIAGTLNVRVALALVARGEAPLGIVYASDAKADPDVRVVDVFPADSHPPILYALARMRSSTNPSATDFSAFLRSPVAAAIFAAEGFAPLPR